MFPSATLKFKSDSLNHLLFNTQPDLACLIVFGSLCYASTNTSHTSNRNILIPTLPVNTNLPQSLEPPHILPQSNQSSQPSSTSDVPPSNKISPRPKITLRLNYLKNYHSNTANCNFTANSFSGTLHPLSQFLSYTKLS